MYEILKNEFVQSLTNLTGGVGDFSIKLAAAALFLALGFIFGTAVGRVVEQLVEALKADEWLRKAGVENALSKAGYQMRAGKFFGALAKLFFIVLMLVPAFDIIGLAQVNMFLNEVLSYIPQVIIAALILFIASVAADILGDMVHGTGSALGSRVSHLLGTVTRVAIWVFAIIMALSQLGIAPQYMLTLFTGFVAMLAIAGGLAFGLGGKEAAADLIKEIRTDIKLKK
jgi:hypothetical protein